MTNKPVTRFLLQERKDQKSHLYAWTPSLAQRNDMRPITAEEAREFIQVARDEETRQRRARIAAEAEALEAQKDERPLNEQYPERDLKPTIDALDEIGEKAVFDDNSLVSQEDLLALEIRKVNGFKKASSLEEFMLKKYRMTMLVRPDLADMKSDAKVALAGLAKEQKLYKLVE